MGFRAWLRSVFRPSTSTRPVPRRSRVDSQHRHHPYSSRPPRRHNTAQYYQPPPPPPVTRCIRRVEGMPHLRQEPPRLTIMTPPTPPSRTSSLRRITTPPEPVVETTPMTPAELNEVLQRLGPKLAHIPFAVVGLAAMVHWGFRAGSPSHISILCPSSARAVLRGWVAANGLHTFRGSTNTFGVPSADGRLRRVRVKFLDEGFETLQRVYAGEAHVPVLGLGSMADEIARAYAVELRHNQGLKQNNLARDLIWVLETLVRRDMPGVHLTPETAPHIHSSAFWEPFSLSYPQYMYLFAEAGMRLDDAGALFPEDVHDGRQSILIGLDFLPEAQFPVSPPLSGSRFVEHLDEHRPFSMPESRPTSIHTSDRVYEPMPRTIYTEELAHLRRPTSEVFDLQYYMNV